MDAIDNGRRLALGLGVAYVLVGVLGFFVTGFDDFTGTSDEKLLGVFALNPLHNVVHLLIGFGGLALWRRRDTARAYGMALVVGYGATFVYGLATEGILNLNAADNALHLVSAVAGAAILALLGKERPLPSNA